MEDPTSQTTSAPGPAGPISPARVEPALIALVKFLLRPFSYPLDALVASPRATALRGIGYCILSALIVVLPT
jgi:hypothetical protein